MAQAGREKEPQALPHPAGLRSFWSHLWGGVLALAVIIGLWTTSTLSAQLQPESWRVLVLRVDFEFEFPDELSTSGRGTFDLRSIAEAIPDMRLPFDGPPHDRAFYGHHMEALSHYYDVVSEGRVQIEAEVFPQDDTLAYTLPGSILDYGAGRTPEEIGQLWWQLIADATHLAEMDPSGPVFGDYDSYLFIHAGLGFETGQLNDIRSVFLTPTDLSDYGDPIVVDGGATTIKDAWILPEVVVANGRAGLNGILAKFFGHQLGLPGLSNFAAGLPAVGGWSLMDVGANRLGFILWNGVLEPIFGFVPPHPMAWSKARLGWVEPVVVERDTTLSILAGDALSADFPGRAKVVRIPLSPTEYLLLSNRQQRGRPEFDLPEGSLAFDVETSWIDTNEVVFARQIQTSQIDTLAGRGTGPLLRVVGDSYDMFVPSSGILVWHVDSTVFVDTPDFFNSERPRPAIMLHEADGERDIGNAFFDRQDRTEGIRADAFFAGSGVDDVQGTVRFGANTRPSSQTHTGLASGVEIEILDEIAELMRVSIRFTHSAPGWPVSTVEPARLSLLDVIGSAPPQILVSNNLHTNAYDAAGGQLGNWPGRLLAVKNGLFLADEDLVRYIDPRTGTEAGSVGTEAVWSVTADGARSVLVAPLAGFVDPVVVIAGPGSLRLLNASDGVGLASHPLTVNAMSAADLHGDGQLHLLLGATDGLYLADADLSRQGTQAGLVGSIVAMATGDLDNDQKDEVLAIEADGSLWLLDGENLNDLGQLSGLLVSDPVLGDIDADGRLEIVIVTTMGLQVYEVSGVSTALLQADGFPVNAPVHHEVESFTWGPTLADLDGDGSQEILVVAANGLYAFAATGAIVAGFPIPTMDTPNGTPMALDADGDGHFEVAVPTTRSVQLFKPSVASNAQIGATAAWPMAGGDGGGMNRHSLALASQNPMAKNLLPTSSAYCYPNPVTSSDARAHVRFQLTADAMVRLDIYDAIGERVESMQARLSGAAEHELDWPIADYASGLYLCRIEARSDAGGRSEVTLRLAVSQ